MPARKGEKGGAPEATTWPDLPARAPGSRRLTDLLTLGPSEVVAAVGAGGKSTLLERLALDYEAEGAAVILTTTTVVRPPAAGGRPLITGRSLGELLASLRQEPRRSPLVGLGLEGGKLRGLPPSWIPELRDLPWVQAVLVEADGSAGLPLKAPSHYEPVVPAGTSLLVSLAGLDAQGAPLAAGQVHRPELLCELLDLPLGSELPPAALLLVADKAYRSHVPAGARFVVLLNKADYRVAQDELWALAAGGQTEVWAGSAWTGRFEELRGRDRRPAAVVLAAGLSLRMGGEKVLAQLGGRSVLGRVLGAVAGHPGVREVMVVAGQDPARTDRVLRRDLGGSDYRLLHNETPESGQSSSLRLAVSALTTPSDLLVLLGDQPFVTTSTVSRLLRARSERARQAAVGLAPPDSGAVRAVRPPLIVHRALLPQLLQLQGDQGARHLLSRYARLLVRVPAEGLELLDLDTPADLEQARAALGAGEARSGQKESGLSRGG